ncbi:MAG: hypothetical protein JEZ04_12645 [Spirochaetales bacterium]|nr:hypothetical protein [Spirochaetales bacterium]
MLFRHFYSLKSAYTNPFRDIDGLDADNPIIISTSLPTGIKIPGSGRFYMNFKFPFTGAIDSTNFGGFYGVSLKKTGIYIFVIIGKAGKNLCEFSAVLNELGSAFGRCSCGAVWG